MKTYEAVFNPESEGVYAISLVEDPAMEGLFIALSKQKIELKTVDEEQRILMGLVLEPDKPIYRNQGGEEFNIVFNSQTIKDLSYNFFKSGFQLNSTIEHEGKNLNGVSFVESWIIEDPKIDKSANFGLSYPKGSWIATMKVDNNEVWENYIKTGKVQGFSVDAFVSLKEIKLNSNKMAEEKKDFVSEITDAIKDGFKAILGKEEVEVELGSVALADGSIILMFEGEMLEVGGSVWVEGENGERIPAPVGEHPLENGQVLVIAEEGIAGEIREAQAEVEEELSEPEAPQAPSASQATEDIKSAIKSVLIKYAEEQDAKIDEKLKAFETKFSAIEKENKDLKEEVIKLGEQPVSEPIKARPEQKGSLTKKGRLTEFLNNR